MFSGQKLQKLRKDANLSQAALANKAGLPVRSLEAWEIDRRKPKTDALLALAKALRVPLEALLEGKAGKIQARGRRK